MASPQVSKFTRWLLQSPIASWALSTLRNLLIGALRQGPVPQHIGIVMDGNRRFARKHHIETVEGHNLGAEALARILDVCYKAGVKVVTVYAFSIENFKRSKFEVDALMDMARVKLEQVVQHGELLDRYGASIRILGQRELVKPEVLKAIDDAVRLTSHNTNAVLNICFPYTGRDEITTAIRSTVAEYSRPTRPAHLKRPFSESHIANNIRYRKLSTLHEESLSRSPSPRRDRPGTAPPPGDLPGEEEEEEEEEGKRGPVAGNTNGDVASTKDSLFPPPPPPPATNGDASSSAHSSSTTLHSSEAALSTPSSPPLPHSTSSNSPHFTASTNNNNNNNNNSSSNGTNANTSTTYPDPELITPATLTGHTYTAACPPLDILIRTSGVERLSDFLLWQCHEHTSIVFLECLWPEFDLWRFLPVLVEWQWWRLRGLRERGVWSGGFAAAAAAADGGGGGFGGEAGGEARGKEEGKVKAV